MNNTPVNIAHFLLQTCIGHEGIVCTSVATLHQGEQTVHVRILHRGMPHCLPSARTGQVRTECKRAANRLEHTCPQDTEVVLGTILVQGLELRLWC